MQLSPDVIQLLASSTLSDENADPANWEWDAESRAIWKPAEKNWQDFCDKWYRATEIQIASLVSLSLPLNFDPSISSSIFIPKSYETMFDTVWAQAMLSQGRKGVVITGQPGIGKTLFQYYLLVRLLHRKQVVFFSLDGKKAFLFYRSKVYTVVMDGPGAQYVDESLPEPIPPNVFIWSLFDIDESKGPVPFMYNFPCLPVQTASPNPIRYKTWVKKRMPLLTGLPLWTRDELAQGLQYQYEYRSLLDALHKVYGSSSPNLIDPLALYPNARELLEERYSEEDTVKPSAEDALDYLLDAAIDRFGYSARDVFGGVFAYEEMTWQHESAFNIEYAELRVTVSALSKIRTADFFISQILALSPVYKGPLKSVRWDVDFKSDWVARGVLRALFEAEDTVICDQIRFFRRIPQAQGLAGRLLEPLVHRYLANATDRIWLPINMDSNGVDPPHFTLVRNFSVPDGVRFTKIKRNKIVELESITDLSTCLENNSYYIPVDPSFPLFDAFTIEFDRARKSAILWVIRVTTSRRHVGSTEGYRKIREIIAILKDKLRKGPPLKKIRTAAGHAIPKPRVQVRYLLVNPKHDSQPQNVEWHFPKGWCQNVKKNDHRGKVYYLGVSLDTVYGLPPPRMYHSGMW